MRRALITVVLAGVLVAAGAVPSIAQVAPRTFDDLRAEEHQGEIVYVTDQGGTTEQRRGHAVRGALTGLAIGAMYGVYLGLSDGYCQNYHYEGCARDDAEMIPIVAALFGGIGAGAGAAIGAAIRTERVLYAAPSAPSAHVFELGVAPGAIGLRAQLRF